ncbi:hypothetical protein L7F22_008404 [Adiantum nelumboides]|nr:hypothetical protein [Adiantum nelumboides]
MENALDKLDDLEYELEKAYEWLDDHKGDKRKSCSSRKKVCMLQKACERLRDAYEDEFEEESSDEDDDGWVCMESLVHQVGIPKMEEEETKKEAGQKSLEEPLDNLILPLECAHGVEEEYPLLKITPILSNERMEIGIWREDLNSQESKKGTPHNLILTPTTIDAIDVSCLYEEDFSKEHAIFFHKAHEMLIYPLISYGVLLEAILCDGMCISIHTMNYWKHDGACLPINATTLYLNHARIMMSNFAQRLDGKIWFYLIDYHDGITQWFFLLLCLEGNCLWYFILKVSLKDDDGFLWMAQCIVKMDVFEACYVKANDFLEVEAYARHGDVCNMKLKIMEDVPTLKMVSTLCSWSSHMLISLWFHKFILGNFKAKHRTELAQDIQTHCGIAFTNTQCRNKWDNMKKTFVKEKQKEACSSAEPSRWEFYSRMEDLIGGTPKGSGLGDGFTGEDFVNPKFVSLAKDEDMAAIEGEGNVPIAKEVDVEVPRVGTGDGVDKDTVPNPTIDSIVRGQRFKKHRAATALEGLGVSLEQGVGKFPKAFERIELRCMEWEEKRLEVQFQIAQLLAPRTSSPHVAPTWPV